jgi:hypothetical protein
VVENLGQQVLAVMEVLLRLQEVTVEVVALVVVVQVLPVGHVLKVARHLLRGLLLVHETVRLIKRRYLWITKL